VVCFGGSNGVAPGGWFEGERVVGGAVEAVVNKERGLC
jgi:hypothetical protein